MADRVDLDAYRARISDLLDSPLKPDLPTLRRIHLKHATSIPFENLDIHLGRSISIDLSSIQDKIVRDRRGGYCFEQNTLFAAVLEAIGFDVTRLGARVGDGDLSQLPRTHMALIVRVGGEQYLADVGFGAGELLEPMPFVTAAPTTQFGRTFTLHEDEGVFALQEGERILYRFTLEPEYDVDRVVANHYTSTHPESGFVRTLTVQLQSTDTQWILRGRTLTIIDGTGRRDEVIDTDERLLDVLKDVFGLPFPAGTVFRSPNET